MIYFIGNKEFDVCKIGYSTKENVEARIRGLQTSCPYPLEVINTREGTTKQESKLHNHFKADKLNGEWFKLSKINPFISLAL